MVLVHKSALVATRTDPLGAAGPLIPLRHGGEHGAPQLEAHKRTSFIHSTLSTRAIPRRRRENAFHRALAGRLSHRRYLHELPPCEGHVCAIVIAFDRTHARTNITRLPAVLLASGVQAHKSAMESNARQWRSTCKVTRSVRHVYRDKAKFFHIIQIDGMIRIRKRNRPPLTYMEPCANAFQNRHALRSQMCDGDNTRNSRSTVAW